MSSGIKVRNYGNMVEREREERIEKENENHKGIDKHLSLFCSKAKGKQL